MDYYEFQCVTKNFNDVLTIFVDLYMHVGYIAQVEVEMWTKNGADFVRNIDQREEVLARCTKSHILGLHC